MNKTWSWQSLLAIASAASLVMFSSLQSTGRADEASDYAEEFTVWDGLDVQYDLTSYSGDAHAHHHHAATSCESRGGSRACSAAARCGSTWLWSVEAEAVFLRPNLTDNPITFTLTDLLPAPSSVVLNSGGADIEDMRLAPRLTLGIRQDSGWGLRARTFRLNASQDGFDPLVGVGDVGGTSFNRLDAYYVDLEMTRDVCLGSWSVLGALGVRHAAFERAESLAAAGVVDLGGPVDVIAGNGHASRSFHGTGLTAALQGSRKVRCRGFSWYWNLRGSLLWGDNDNFTSSSAILSGAFGSANSFNQALNVDSDTLFIGEAQLGMEWSRELACMPGRAFVRAGVEGQYWEANEGFSASTSTAGTLGQSSGTILTTQRELEMDMFGLVFGAGMEW